MTKTLPIIVGSITVPIFVFGYFVGTTGLIIAFSVSGLLVFGTGCFAAGAYWTERTIKQGAGIAITSTSKNDEYDTRKIEALAGLAQATIKGYVGTQNQMLKQTPQLQANNFTVEEGVFDELD